jgi:hypothetical protein
LLKLLLQYSHGGFEFLVAPFLMELYTIGLQELRWVLSYFSIFIILRFLSQLFNSFLYITLISLHAILLLLRLHPLVDQEQFITP